MRCKKQIGCLFLNLKKNVVFKMFIFLKYGIIINCFPLNIFSFLKKKY